MRRKVRLLFLTYFDEVADICIFYEDEGAYYDGKTINFIYFIIDK